MVISVYLIYRPSGYCDQYPCDIFPSEPTQEELVRKFDLSQCCPKGYEMEGVQVFRDIQEAVKGRDIICTDSLPLITLLAIGLRDIC